MAYLAVHVRFSSWASGVVVLDRFLHWMGSEATVQGVSITMKVEALAYTVNTLSFRFYFLPY